MPGVMPHHLGYEVGKYLCHSSFILISGMPAPEIVLLKISFVS